MKVAVTVNGAAVAADVEDRMLLVHYLRETAGLTATNVGCDTTSCGACTVLLDGESVKSCTVLAAQADGRQVTTVEGLAGRDGELHPVQRAFRAEHGLQCGFCTPGMVMAAVSLLRENPHPTEAEVRAGLEGNLCRCTGYHNIVRAVLAAGAASRRGGLRSPHDPRAVRPTSGRFRRGSPRLLAEHGEDAKFLAGGHSLLPLMKLRLAMPEVLIDIGRCGTSATSATRATTSRSARSPATATWSTPPCWPGRAAARARRRPGGRPAGPPPGHDRRVAGPRRPARPTCPPSVLALDATLVARGPSGTREIAAADFFQGLFETALEPDELLTEIRVPMPAPGAAGWSFQKFTKRAIDWAIVGVAVQGRPVALVNMARHAGAGRRGGACAGRRRHARGGRRARRRGHHPGR